MSSPLRLRAVHRVEDGRTGVIELHGVLRSETAHLVREAVGAALADAPTTLVLDLTDVVADDELGLWVLPAMVGHTRSRDVTLLVLVPAPALRRRVRRLGGRPVDVVEAR